MRVLIIADPARKDFFEYLTNAAPPNIEWAILWDYSYEARTLEKEYYISGNNKAIKLYYWSQFKTPSVLVNLIMPDKIVFLEIIDLWQIPLIVYCKTSKITTFFLEHGVGNSINQVTSRFNEDFTKNEKINRYVKKIIYSLKRVLANRQFYYSQLLKFNNVKDWVRYLVLPYKIKTKTPIEALSKLRFKARTPDYALLFNVNNILPFLLYNEICENKIITEGVPFFDKYAAYPVTENDHYFFVEHPYLEENILGWTDAFHKSVALAIEEFAESCDTHIFVKLHPRSNKANWDRYGLDKNFITILQLEDPTELMLSAKIIFGYSSTLVGAMICCKKNIVLLGWHPDPHIFGEDYSSTGLCHKSLDIYELQNKIEEWQNNNLALKDSVGYDLYLKEYNSPFDGKSTRRLLEAIVTL